jgi:cytochrome c553
VALLPSIAAFSGNTQAAADIERGRGVALGASTAVSPRSACHTCHGLNGAGDASGAFPRLSGQSAWYLYKQLRDYAAGERENPIMSPIAKALNDQEMEDVAAFYAEQSAPDLTQAKSAPDPQLLQQGAAISATGLQQKGVAACVNCHGPAGRGLPPSYPYLAGQYAPYVELQFRLWREGQRHNSPLGVMEHIAAQLSDEEVKALAAYFSSLPPPRSRDVVGSR